MPARMPARDQARTQAVAPVVVGEWDEASRALLHDILALDGHYSVIAFADETAALASRAAAPARVIVVVSKREVHHQRSAAFFAVVAAGERLVTRHRYLLLSTNPREMPAGLQAKLTSLQATILVTPFEVETLLAAVREEAARRATRPLPLASALARRATPAAPPAGQPAVWGELEGPEAGMKRHASATPAPRQRHASATPAPRQRHAHSSAGRCGCRRLWCRPMPTVNKRRLPRASSRHIPAVHAPTH
jgi:hypothetical protein